jgi:hypothetical protein
MGQRDAWAGPVGLEREEGQPGSGFWYFGNKGMWLRARVVLEFEFDSHSNSNFTHLNSK